MIDNNEESKLLTVSEVADLLHVHANTLRRWSEEGRINCYRITPRGDRRFKKKDLDSFLNEYNPSIDNLK